MSKIYSALGGSMSIDDYPIFDLVEQTKKPYKRVGSASLLFRNNDELWPEFTGRDLSHAGYTEFELLARDGARMPDVLGEQLSVLNPDSDLITLTIGGNDLLHILATFHTMDEVAREARDLYKEYSWLVDRLHQQAPRATIVCTTIYDPTDGTGRFRPETPPVPISLLYELNAAILATCGEKPFTKLADVATHFRGHGVTVPETDRWFWKGSVIEPSARGASEIRRMWAEAIGL
jgi:lysophospholipase L1-like esterase